MSDQLLAFSDLYLSTNHLVTTSPPPQPKPPEPAETLLEVRGVSMRFGAQTVLRDIDLRIDRGQTLAIIGESGCGKTVLLKTLIGLLRPSQGEVALDGRSLSDMTEKELTATRLRFGFVFQNAALFDSMTIGQNVAFPLRQHKQMTAAQRREAVVQGLAQVGLPESVVNKRPAELSGGMRKRVGLARALIMNPEVVLYDEPTTGLDPIMSDVISELILNVRQGRQGVTSVMVTHDMRSAMKVADRVVMLYPLSRLREDESQILFDGQPEALERHDDIRVRQFVKGEAGERLMEMNARS